MPRATVKNIRKTFIKGRGHKKARLANIAKANAARLYRPAPCDTAISPNSKLPKPIKRPKLPKPIQRPKPLAEPIKVAAKGKRIRKSELKQEFEAQRRYKDLASFKNARTNVLAKKRMERHRDRSFEKKKAERVKAVGNTKKFLNSLRPRAGLTMHAIVPLNVVENVLYHAKRAMRVRRIKKHPNYIPAKKKWTRNRPRLPDSRRSIRARRKKLIEDELEFPDIPSARYQRAFIYNRQLEDGAFRSAKRKAFRAVPVTDEFLTAQSRNRNKQKGRNVDSGRRKRRYCSRPGKSARVN